MNPFLQILIAFLPFIASAQNADLGTEALKNERYDEAILLYKVQLDDGQTSPELHYNLGLAYAETQQIGYALWHFNLASLTGLQGDALAHNIRLIKEQRIDDVEIVPEFFLKRWFNSWKRMLSSNSWAFIALVSLFLGIYGLLRWRRANERASRKSGFIYGGIGLFFSLVALISSVDAANDIANPKSGILLVKQAALKAAGDDDSAEILDIHEGIELEIKDEIGAWSKVRLLNGQEGWLLSKDIGFY